MELPAPVSWLLLLAQDFSVFHHHHHFSSFSNGMQFNPFRWWIQELKLATRYRVPFVRLTWILFNFFLHSERQQRGPLIEPNRVVGLN